MSERPAPSWALALYYAFVFATTALAYGAPYPVFGVLLEGLAARAAVLVDCLLVLHILLGIWRCQTLSWYLLLGYNGVQLTSLAVTLALLDAAQIQTLTRGVVAARELYLGAAVAAAAMLLATVFAYRARDRFWNRDPFLF